MRKRCKATVHQRLPRRRQHASVTELADVQDLGPAGTPTQPPSWQRFADSPRCSAGSPKGNEDFGLFIGLGYALLFAFVLGLAIWGAPLLDLALEALR